ncbi:hypothetical protein CPB83DRAFT_860977 [Crepidotus variabilis]|uniref:MalT-like TPR region domain-containing protein n=1 Tax=Crepidotus variabilis TaxID=179855 RepID=A0A9P6E916_9AGAR|nr:hypothetical protein CPB83DRAFT_860977 [Crepidotus variabilis]
MKIATQMLRLADAYWGHYRQHYGSEGVNRGQGLQKRAYDLLCAGLGPWSVHTKEALRRLCRWDINGAERRSILDSILSHMKRQNGAYEDLDAGMAQDIVLCCLRNGDYNDNVKALQLLRMGSISSTIKPYSFESMLFAIHRGRQEWNKAEEVVEKALKQDLPDDVRAEMYANIGVVQVRQGRLVDGEASLRKGMKMATGRDLGMKYLICRDRLMELYMQQERWTDAERIGRRLIRIREHQCFNHFDSGARIIEMSWWRAVEWRTPVPDKEVRWSLEKSVYYLHALYNTKRQLGVIYLHQKRYDKAQEVLEELMENKMHRKNLTLMASKELLLTVYVDSGQWEIAEKFQEKVIDEMVREHGQDSYSLIPALDKLASIRELAVTFYIKAGQLNGAEKFQERFIQMMKERFEEDSGKFIPALDKLASIRELLVSFYLESGKLDTAEKKQEQIIEEMTERFGYDSEKLILELEKLVDICQRNNHFGKRHDIKVRLLRYR